MNNQIRSKPNLVSRRRAVTLISGAVVTTTLNPIKLVNATPRTNASSIEEYLKQDFARGLQYPDATGQVDQRDFELLFRLLNWLRLHFEFTESTQSSLDESRFKRIIDLKTKFTPSYFTEYKMAIDTCTYLDTAMSGSSNVAVNASHSSQMDNAFNLLMFYEEAQASHATRAGHIQNYVLDEFLTLLISFGGFKRFGIANTYGYMSKPFLHPEAPYRIWNF